MESTMFGDRNEQQGKFGSKLSAGQAPPVPIAYTPTASAPTARMRQKQQGCVLVSPVFAHFFLMLWYVCKIEHIIKAYTKGWMDEVLASTSPEAEGVTMGLPDQPLANAGTLCRMFAEEDDFFEKMHRVYEHGYSYIRRSLEEGYIGEKPPEFGI